MTHDEIRKLAEEVVQSCADLDAGDEEYWVAVDSAEAALLRVQKETARECAEIMDKHEGWDTNGDPIRRNFGLEPER